MPTTPQEIKLTPLRCRRAAAILLEMHQLSLSTGESELGEATNSAPATVRIYLRLLEKLGLVTRFQYHYGHVLTPAGVQLITRVLDPAAGTPEKRRARVLAAEIEAALLPSGAAPTIPLQGPSLDFADCCRDILEKTPFLSTGYPQPTPQTVDKTASFENIFEKTPVREDRIPDSFQPDIQDTPPNRNILEKTPFLSTGYPQPDPQTVDKTASFRKVLEKLADPSTGDVDESANFGKPLENLAVQTEKNTPFQRENAPNARASTTTAESLTDSLKDSSKKSESLKAVAVETADARAKTNFAALHAYGVGQNNRVRAICSREGVTPEYIHAQAEKLKGQGKLSARLLIHCVESGDPLEPLQDPHLDSSRYLEWGAPRELSERDRARYADWAKPAEERERARHAGGAAYAKSWGSR